MCGSCWGGDGAAIKHPMMNEIAVLLCSSLHSMFQRGLNRVTEALPAGRSAIGAFIGGFLALYSTYPASRSIWRIYMGCAWVGADCGVFCHAPGGPWASHDGRRFGSWAWTMAETPSTAMMDCGGKRGSAMRLMNNIYIPRYQSRLRPFS